MYYKKSMQNLHRFFYLLIFTAISPDIAPSTALNNKSVIVVMPRDNVLLNTEKTIYDNTAYTVPIIKPFINPFVEPFNAIIHAMRRLTPFIT